MAWEEPGVRDRASTVRVCMEWSKLRSTEYNESGHSLPNRKMPRDIVCVCVCVCVCAYMRACVRACVCVCDVCRG